MTKFWSSVTRYAMWKYSTLLGSKKSHDLDHSVRGLYCKITQFNLLVMELYLIYPTNKV